MLAAISNLPRYTVALCSDDEQFCGHSRVSASSEYFAQAEPWHDRPNSLLVYSPSRTVLVLQPE